MGAVYQPEAMTFPDTQSRIREGSKRIREAGGALSIDAANLEDGGTLALCAMLEWRRQAQSANCQLSFANIPARLIKLIGIYQLKELVYEGECKPVARPPAEAKEQGAGEGGNAGKD